MVLDSTQRTMVSIVQVMGARARRAREAKKLSRKAVFERFGDGYTESALQAIENGRNELSQEKMRRFSRLYRVPLYWLQALDVETRRDGTTVLVPDTANEDAALEKLSELPPPSESEESLQLVLTELEAVDTKGQPELNEYALGKALMIIVQALAGDDVAASITPEQLARLSAGLIDEMQVKPHDTSDDYVTHLSRLISVLVTDALRIRQVVVPAAYVERLELLTPRAVQFVLAASLAQQPPDAQEA